MKANFSISTLMLLAAFPAFYLLPLSISSAEEAKAGNEKIPDSLKADSWTLTEFNFHSLGVPGHWEFLGPIPDSKFTVFNQKEALEPQTSDDWTQPLVAPSGKPFRKEQWSRPEGSSEWFIDLAEIVVPKEKVLLFARTEIQWPEAGKAMLWFDTHGRSEGFLNNHRVFQDVPDRRRWVVPRGPKGVLVDMQKGRNIIKLKLGQHSGPFGFSIRFERRTPEYLLRKNRKMLEWFPEEALRRRGGFVRLRIAGILEQLGRKEEALEVFTKVETDFKHDFDVSCEARMSRERVASKRKDEPEQVSKAWKQTQEASLRLRKRGLAARADELLLEFMSRYSGHVASAEAMLERGRLRFECGLSRKSQPFYERALNAYPQVKSIQKAVADAFDKLDNFRPEKILFETTTEFQNTVENAKRQMRSGEPDDIRKAMRNLGWVLRQGADIMVRLRSYPEDPKYVGLREDIRGLLAQLGEGPRKLYRETVAGASELQFQRAFSKRDPSALEKVVSTYPYTSAAEKALNAVGNIYMDRGEYGRAGYSFRMLLDELSEQAAGDPAVLAAAAAKLLHCQIKIGDLAGAHETARKLAEEWSNQEFTLAGKRISAAAFSQKLLARLDAAEKESGAPSDAGLATFAGGMARTGADPKASSPTLNGLTWMCNRFNPTPVETEAGAHWPDPTPNLLPQPYPVFSKGKVYVTTLDSAMALESGTGKVLWQRKWDSFAWPVPSEFSGFPVSCPSVKGDRLFMRAFEGYQISLRCLDAASGKVLWDNASDPDVKGMVPLSDPAVAYGSAIFVYLKIGLMNTHGVAAINIEDGRLLWKRPLVTGSTGLKLEGAYYGTSMQLGPPAVDEGMVYTATGACSVAALNAFTGDLKWLASYPRLDMKHIRTRDQDLGAARISRYMRWLSRGPLSPMPVKGRLLFAPKDGPGLLAFDRKTGDVVWHHDLNDDAYLIGVCGNNALLAGASAKGVDLDSGVVSWRYDLKGNGLAGRPGYAGGLLYLPTRKGLAILDAKQGELQSQRAWDVRSGPVGNLLVTSNAVIGVSHNLIAALGKSGTASPRMHLASALIQERRGELVKASAEYESVLKSDTSRLRVPALTGMVRTLAAQGKLDELKKVVAEKLGGASGMLEAEGGSWRVGAGVLENGLLAEAGAKLAVHSETPLDWDSPLSFAWQIDGRAPRLFFPAAGYPDRFFVYANSRLRCVRASSSFELLWENRVWSGIQGFAVGPQAVALLSKKGLEVLNRFTGERMWACGIRPDRIGVSVDADQDDSGRRIAMDDDTVVVQSGADLLAFDLRSGAKLWENKEVRRAQEMLVLSMVGKRVAEVRGYRKGPTTYNAYHKRSGKKIESKTVCKETGRYRTYHRMPDGRHVIVRPAGQTLVCLDMANGNKVWEAGDLVKALQGKPPITFDGRLIRHVSSNKPRDEHTYFIDPKDGRIQRVLKQGKAIAVEGNEFLRLQGTRVTRCEFQKEAEHRHWTYSIPGNYRTPRVLSAFVAGNRLYLHSMCARIPSKVYEDILDWASGQRLQRRQLPDAWHASGTIKKFGNLLLISGADGLFAYAPAGPRKKIVARLLADLNKPEVQGRKRLNCKRLVAELKPPLHEAFRAPADVRLDGDLGEWAGFAPIELNRRSDFAPLASDAIWRGPTDLSAKVCTAWDSKGLYLSIQVQDDVLVSPRGGPSSVIGDSVYLALTSNAGSFHQAYIGRIALTKSGPALFTQVPDQLPQGAEIESRVAVASDGSGVGYEIFIPWVVVREQTDRRPGMYPNLKFGVAVYDDDGEGTKGAMEWGAGLVGGRLIEQRLGTLVALNMSTELIARYREVISMLPDSSEAIRHLDAILSSKRGPKAFGEREEILKDFLRSHPNSANAGMVLGRLYRMYRSKGDNDAQQKAVSVARLAGCSPKIIDGFLNTALNVWVFPDPESPPKMVMLKFKTEGGWDRRAYWGEALIQGSHSAPKSDKHIRLGAVPDSGTWTCLKISAADLGLEGLDVLGVVFSIFGGRAYFDSFSLALDGKVTVLMEDALPKDFSARDASLSFVAQRPHAGTKAWTIGEGKGLQAARVEPHRRGPWFTFRTASLPADKKVQPAEPQRLKEQRRYREAASLLASAPDSWAYLDKAMKLYPESEQMAGSIEECETYLKRNPHTSIAPKIFDHLRIQYRLLGVKNIRARFEKLMASCRLPQATRRSFYIKQTKGWDRWHVLGPFVGAGSRRGLDRFMEPERAVDLTWKPEGPGKTQLKWMQTEPEKKAMGVFGYVDLHGCLIGQVDREHREDVERGTYFGYAWRTLAMPTRRRAVLYFGADDMVSIWVNGRKVVTERSPGRGKDSGAVAVQLNKGKNEILLKVGTNGGRCGFYFRVADDNGRPFDDLPQQ